MGEFNLDTSGEVGPLPAGPYNERFMRWSDLSPFQQGYVEAALSGPIARWDDEDGNQSPRFSDFAPETLAAMLRDCEAWQRRHGWIDRPDSGATFWQYRKLKTYPGRRFGCRKMIPWPPVTVYLGDDGLIYQREAA